MATVPPSIDCIAKCTLEFDVMGEPHAFFPGAPCRLNSRGRLMMEVAILANKKALGGDNDPVTDTSREYSYF